MTLQQLKTIIAMSHTIAFAIRGERGTEQEILKEMLRGINEHIKQLQEKSK